MCHRIEPLTIEEVEEALANLARHGRATLHRSAPPTPAPTAPSEVPDGTFQPQPPQAGPAQAYPGASVPIVVAGPGSGGGRQPEDPGLKAAVMTWGFWSQHPKPAGRPNPPDGPAGAPGCGGSDPCTPPDAPPAALPAEKVVAASKLVFNTRLDTGVRQLRAGRGMWADAMANGRCLVPVRAFYENGPAPIRRPFRFSLVGSTVFLLAGIAEDGRFSIVTTSPNSRVAPVHNRMPLVLAPGESHLWLAGDLRDPAVLGRLADRGSVALDATADEPQGNGSRG